MIKISGLQTPVHEPYSIQVCSQSGDIYFATMGMIKKIRVDGSYVDVLGCGTKRFRGITTPLHTALYVSTFCLDEVKKRLVIADNYNCRIFEFDIVKEELDIILGDGTSGRNGVGHLAKDANIEDVVKIRSQGGNIYYVDKKERNIRMIGENGILMEVPGSKYDTSQITDFCISPEGTFYITDGKKTVVISNGRAVNAFVGNNRGIEFSDFLYSIIDKKIDAIYHPNNICELPSYEVENFVTSFTVCNNIIYYADGNSIWKQTNTILKFTPVLGLPLKKGQKNIRELQKKYVDDKYAELFDPEIKNQRKYKNDTKFICEIQNKYVDEKFTELFYSKMFPNLYKISKSTKYKDDPIVEDLMKLAKCEMTSEEFYQKKHNCSKVIELIYMIDPDLGLFGGNYIRKVLIIFESKESLDPNDLIEHFIDISSIESSQISTKLTTDIIKYVLECLCIRVKRDGGELIIKDERMKPFHEKMLLGMCEINVHIMKYPKLTKLVYPCALSLDRLKDSIGSMYNDQNTSDIIVIIGQLEIHAHRAMLARIPMFSGMFEFEGSKEYYYSEEKKKYILNIFTGEPGHAYEKLIQNCYYMNDNEFSDEISLDCICLSDKAVFDSMTLEILEKVLVKNKKLDDCEYLIELMKLLSPKPIFGNVITKLTEKFHSCELFKTLVENEDDKSIGEWLVHFNDEFIENSSRTSLKRRQPTRQVSKRTKKNKIE